MPLLTIAQEQSQNWLPVVAMDYVADYLQIPRMRAYEVATFYTMYNLEPVGEYFIEVCTTTPCWLRGSDEIVRTCKEELGIGIVPKNLALDHGDSLQIVQPTEKKWTDYIWLLHRRC